MLIKGNWPYLRWDSPRNKLYLRCTFLRTILYRPLRHFSIAKAICQSFKLWLNLSRQFCMLANIIIAAQSRKSSYKPKMRIKTFTSR